MRKGYFALSDHHLKRFESVYEGYKKMFTDPDNCSPMFIIEAPVKDLPTWEERLDDPAVMLKAGLDQLRNHLEIEDDRVPTVRVDFGTAQIAAAFGCEIFVPDNNLPAAGSHVIKNCEEVFSLNRPSLTAGWYGKLKAYTEIFLENLPDGVHIQHPDIQSAFNSAHLIRGNDIMLDFFDCPEAVEVLLDKVTDYMLELIPYLKNMISSDREWFFDWGALWRGCARISNCSMHMISPQLYEKFVFPRDVRFMKAIGRGRIHYCGTADSVIDLFFNNNWITGLDFDCNLHDLWSLSQRAPANLTLLTFGSYKTCDERSSDSKMLERLLRGDWPDKRNIIVQVQVDSVEEGKELIKRLRASVPD